MLRIYVNLFRVLDLLRASRRFEAKSILLPFSDPIDKS